MDSIDAGQLDRAGIDGHQMAGSMVQADGYSAGNLVEPFAVDVFQLGVAQDQRIDTISTEPVLIVIFTGVLFYYLAQLGNDLVRCFAASGNLAVSSMPVKVADVNIIHIIQAALLSVHMGFDKTGINNIVDKRIIDLIRSSMRFKISLHIDKITDCDNSAAGNGNTFCPRHLRVHGHYLLRAVDSNLSVLKDYWIGNHLKICGHIHKITSL